MEGSVCLLWRVLALTAELREFPSGFVWAAKSPGAQALWGAQGIKKRPRELAPAELLVVRPGETARGPADMHPTGLKLRGLWAAGPASLVIYSHKTQGMGKNEQLYLRQIRLFSSNIFSSHAFLFTASKCMWSQWLSSWSYWIYSALLKSSSMKCCKPLNVRWGKKGRKKNLHSKA